MYIFPPPFSPHTDLLYFIIQRFKVKLEEILHKVVSVWKQNAEKSDKNKIVCQTI